MKEAPSTEIESEETQVLRLILRALREIRYGSIQIVIQDSKVVQIEKLEKIRLVNDPNIARGLADQTTGGYGACPIASLFCSGTPLHG